MPTLFDLARISRLRAFFVCSMNRSPAARSSPYRPRSSLVQRDASFRRHFFSARSCSSQAAAATPAIVVPAPARKEADGGSGGGHSDASLPRPAAPIRFDADRARGGVVFVSRQLGHADPSITLRAYAHLFVAHAEADRTRALLQAAVGNVLETQGGDTRRTSPVAEIGNTAQLRVSATGGG